uniref:Pilus assembly protein PilP n=1 Tax=candidate division WOR-3 bacterium TaxID=2052148 RepID=A0A7C4Y4X0_UNCW3
MRKRRKLLVSSIFIMLSLIGCSNSPNLFNRIVDKTIAFFSPKFENNTYTEKIILSQMNPIPTGVDTLDFSKIDTVRDVNEALKWELFVYDDRGKPDPFTPLITRGASEKGLQVEDAELVGTIWGPNGYIALVKEIGGSGYVLREGDKVINGYVEKIDKNSITFKLQQFEQVQKITLYLKSKEGEK